MPTTEKSRGGRPRKYATDMTPSEKTAARTAERQAQGWTRVNLWLPPGVTPEQVRKYVKRKAK